MPSRTSRLFLLFPADKGLEVELERHHLLASGIAPAVEVENHGCLEGKEIGYMRLIEEFQPVIEARLPAVHVHLVERLTHIQKVTIHISGKVNIPEIRHHVRAVEETVLHAHIPVPDGSSEFSPVRESVFPYILPVILHRLQPA